MEFVICSASRHSRDAFFQSSALGRSLAVTYRTFRFDLKIFFENRRGLSACYNEVVEEKGRSLDEVLIFVHDDVLLVDYFWLDKLPIGFRSFDLLGVAGNRRRTPRQPSWAFLDDRLRPDEAANLSGVVGHGPEFPCELSFFGPALQKCALLDGVFLAARRRAFLENDIRFDETFAFHFYDMDLCRQFEAAGLAAGTVPLGIVHQSAGAFGSRAWKAAYAAYLRKWTS